MQRETTLQIRVSILEKKAIEFAAAQAKVTTATWVRTTLGKAITPEAISSAVSATRRAVLVKTGRPPRGICQIHKRLDCQDPKCF